MLVPVLPRLPVLVKYEHIGVLVALMKVIINAARFLSRLIDKATQNVLEFRSPSGFGGEIRDDRAHVVHLKTSCAFLLAAHFRDRATVTARIIMMPRAISCWLNSKAAEQACPAKHRRGDDGEFIPFAKLKTAGAEPTGIEHSRERGGDTRNDQDLHLDVMRFDTGKSSGGFAAASSQNFASKGCFAKSDVANYGSDKGPK